MKKTIHNKAGKPVYTIGITKSRDSFRWKPEVIPHWKSLHTISFDVDNPPVYKSKSLYVPMFCQVFWLGLIFYVKIHQWELGEGKMVRYEDSHYREIDEALSENKI